MWKKKSGNAIKTPQTDTDQCGEYCQLVTHGIQNELTTYTLGV